MHITGWSTFPLEGDFGSAKRFQHVKYNKFDNGTVRFSAKQDSGSLSAAILPPKDEKVELPEHFNHGSSDATRKSQPQMGPLPRIPDSVSSEQSSLLREVMEVIPYAAVLAGLVRRRKCSRDGRIIVVM